MPQAEFELSIPVFQRSKTVRALDRVANRTGSEMILYLKLEPKYRLIQNVTRALIT
jgi:hypothetical protein